MAGPLVLDKKMCNNRWALEALRRYSSGQRGETVNLLDLSYEGSNPSRRTQEKILPIPSLFSSLKPAIVSL